MSVDSPEGDVEIAEGALYRSDEPAEWTDATEGPHNQCLGCGTELLESAKGESRGMARDVLRVFGDENGCIPRCPECTDYSRLSVAARKGIKIEGVGVTLKGATLGGEI